MKVSVRHLDAKLLSVLQAPYPCYWQENDKQLRSYRALLGERDKIGAQLVKQNGEIAVLQEKIRLQTSSLQVKYYCKLSCIVD